MFLFFFYEEAFFFLFLFLFFENARIVFCDSFLWRIDLFLYFFLSFMNNSFLAFLYFFMRFFLLVLIQQRNTINVFSSTSSWYKITACAYLSWVESAQSGMTSADNFMVVCKIGEKILRNRESWLSGKLVASCLEVSFVEDNQDQLHNVERVPPTLSPWSAALRRDSIRCRGLTPGQ